MNLTLEQKQEIGRQVREENSGSKELQICEMFGLTQVGGSRTKVDGQHPDGTNWSIKNAKSKSTQVHLTSQERFIEEFSLGAASQEFVRKFFGSLDYEHMPRRRYRIDEIPDDAVNQFKSFLESNKEEVIYYFLSGKFDIRHVVYNKMHMTTDEILEQVRKANWVYNPTAIHLKNEAGKTLFHIQMKGSGKGKVKHGVLCHIHENLFLGRKAQ